MSKPQKWRDAIGKGWTRLLRPFIAWTLLGLALDTLLYGLDRWQGWGIYGENEIIRSIGSLLLNGSVHGNMPVWFLFSYFMVKVFSAWIGERKSKWGVACVLALAWLLPYGLQQVNFRYPYYLCNACVGFVAFYGTAWLIGKVREIQKVTWRRLWLFAVVGVFVLVPIVCPVSYDIRTNTVYAGIYPLWWIWAMTACVVIAVLFKHSPWLVLVAKRLGLCWAGRKSMFFQCYHWPMLVLLDFARKVFAFDIPHEWMLAYYCAGLLMIGIPLYFLVNQSKVKKYLL